MRFRLRPFGADRLFAAVLTTILAGCSTGSPDTIQTSSLSPRPQEGMVRDTPPRYSEAPRRYVDPGHPTPREFAAASDRYDLNSSGNIQTASIGEPRRTPYYAPEARWRQPTSPITTGSTGYPRETPNIIQVREGDTLYSLSRRYNVPVQDLVAANRLTSERIAIGQSLVIPTRYR